LIEDSDNPDKNIYAAAFMKPDYNWANQQGYSTNTVTFNLNFNNFEEISRLQLASEGSKNSENDEFWVVYILLGYQHFKDEDNDPDEETKPDGQTILITAGFTLDGGTTDVVSDSKDVPKGEDVSMVYLEAAKDRDFLFRNTPGKLPDFRMRTLPHEIGHQFALKGDPQSTTGQRFGIMDRDVAPVFVPQHLNVLRWRVNSPGRK